MLKLVMLGGLTLVIMIVVAATEFARHDTAAVKARELRHSAEPMKGGSV